MLSFIAINRILSFLEPREMYGLRAVSRAWMESVDHKTANEEWWEKLCIKEFPTVYKNAHNISQLSYRDLCKSLFLWRKVSTANLTCKKLSFLAIDSLKDKDVQIQLGMHKSFTQLLPNHVLSVASKKKEFISIDYLAFDTITHYNLKTGDMLRKWEFDRPFDAFQENDTLLLLILSQKYPTDQISVVPKHTLMKLAGNSLFCHVSLQCLDNKNIQTDFIRSICSDYVILLENEIYYLNKTVNISTCELDDDLEFCTNEWVDTHQSVDKYVSSMAHDGKNFHFLTINNKVVHSFYLKHGIIGKRHIRETSFSKVFHRLRMLGFFSRENNVAEMVYKMSENVPDEIVDLNISLLQTYADMVFLVVNRSKLYIYYSPMSFGILNIRRTKPDRIFDLNEEFGPSPLHDIHHIDVVEIEYGHVILVQTWEFVCALTLSH